MWASPRVGTASAVPSVNLLRMASEHLLDFNLIDSRTGAGLPPTVCSSTSGTSATA
jgi:hypothetical protein